MTIKRVCAWHKTYFGEDLVMEDGDDPPTHGMCAECFKMLMKETDMWDDETKLMYNERKRNDTGAD